MKHIEFEECSGQMSRAGRWWLLPLCAALGACSSDPVELGDGPLGVDRSALASYAAAWEGYVEAYEFSSGSDRVRLVLDASGSGTVRFGEGETLPVPTDPEAAFPFDRFSNPVESEAAVPTPIEGFDYAITGALVEDERLRAALPTQQIFASACALQTPYALEPATPPDADLAPGALPAPPVPPAPGSSPGYACLPNVGYSYRSIEEGCFIGPDAEPVSCTQAMLCNHYCDCTATECTPRSFGSELRFDGALDASGERLEGTLVGLRGPNDAGDRAVVRLTRVAAGP